MFLLMKRRYIDRANFISGGYRDFNQSVDDTYRNVMTEEERRTYNYLLNTQGRDKAEEFYQTALPVLKHRVTYGNAFEEPEFNYFME